MINYKEEYKNIEIFRKECSELFILLYKNRTLSVGFLVKDILFLLQNDISNIHDIKENIKTKHNIDITIYDIKRVIDFLNKFISKNNKSYFIKICKLCNPNYIKKNMDFMFERRLFYIIFFLSFISNFILFLLLNQKNSLDIKQSLIFTLLLILILLLHEVGHSLSAKKYGINCKEIGLGLYLIFPILYINLGEIWKLCSWKRIIINLSGIYTQLILGIIIGTFAIVIDSHILSLLFFSNISIALLNINPFIKYDGYWVLSDLLNSGNLSKESDRIIKNIFCLNYDKEENLDVLIYSLIRICFMFFFVIYILLNLIDIVYKITNNTTLIFKEYFLLLFIVVYIIIILRKWIFKLNEQNL